MGHVGAEVGEGGRGVGRSVMSKCWQASPCHINIPNSMGKQNMPAGHTIQRGFI